MKQTVLLTGGSGFWGRHLRQGLEDREYFVIAPKSYEMSLNNLDQIDQYVGECPDYIIHAAANCGGLPYNKANPHTLFQDNMEMGLNLIRCVIHWKEQYGKYWNLRKFVSFGTICMYPKFPREIPFVEEDLFYGFPEETNAPYALAKQGVMIAGNAARAQHGLPFVTVMPTNTYGPGDCTDERSHVIGAALKKLYDAKHNNTVPSFFGDGSATRDFLFVRDGVEAVINAMESYNEVTPLNIGSGRETSIKDIVDCVAFWMGYQGHIRWDGNVSMNGQPRRVLNIDRARAALAWEPKTSLDNGIRETVEWYVGQ